MSDNIPIIHPKPRRPDFNLTPATSNESSEAPTPVEPTSPDFLNPRDAVSPNVSRNGSIMNLTSSTLFGIYSPTAFSSSRDDMSPWGTEAQSSTVDSRLRTTTVVGTKPSSDRVGLKLSRSRLSHGLFRGVIAPPALRAALLFAFGITYGIITMHVHENHWITPVKLESIRYYNSWQYLGLWGLAGVILGNVLPLLDYLVEGPSVRNDPIDPQTPGENYERGERTHAWVTVARSVGAFVGIAFAMRRLHWQSTTQASVTLSLANPVLWYLIDRTRTGFTLSTTVGIAGMFIILGLRPELVPSSLDSTLAPSALDAIKGECNLTLGISQEGIAVRTWISSVLFCACVCFGNIGRQLAIVKARREPIPT